MATAVDYSYARPAPEEIVRQGYSVVWRYLGDWSRDGRCISPGELAHLHANGLRVAFVHQSNQPTAEMSVKRPLSGYQGGLEDARYANGVADQLGVPDWLPIFGAVDVGYGFPAPRDYEAIRGYFTGWLNASRRPVGDYGPYPTVEMLADLQANGRRLEHGWQCAGGSGTGQGSGGTIRTGDGQQARLSRLSAQACAFQHYGLVKIPNTDHNDVFTDIDEWSWHPDIPRDHSEPDWETLMMKAVHLPEEPDGGPKLWQPIEGLLRVAYLDPPGEDPKTDLAELQMTMAIGAVQPEVVTLTGLLAEKFKARYHPIVDVPAFHWGAVAIMGETVKQITDAMPKLDPEAVRQAIQAGLEGVAVDVDLEAISEQVTAKVFAALAQAAHAAAEALG